MHFRSLAIGDLNKKHEELLELFAQDRLDVDNRLRVHLVALELVQLLQLTHVCLLFEQVHQSFTACAKCDISSCLLLMAFLCNFLCKLLPVYFNFIPKQFETVF